MKVKEAPDLVSRVFIMLPDSDTDNVNQIKCVYFQSEKLKMAENQTVLCRLCGQDRPIRAGRKAIPKSTYQETILKM